MNVACCVLRVSKGSSASSSRSGSTYSRRRARAHVLKARWKRAESAHSVARVTVAIPPQHISKC